MTEWTLFVSQRIYHMRCWGCDRYSKEIWWRIVILSSTKECQVFLVQFMEVLYKIGYSEHKRRRIHGNKTMRGIHKPERADGYYINSGWLGSQLGTARHNWCCNCVCGGTYSDKVNTFTNYVDRRRQDRQVQKRNLDCSTHIHSLW